MGIACKLHRLRLNFDPPYQCNPLSDVSKGYHWQQFLGSEGLKKFEEEN